MALLNAAVYYKRLGIDVEQAMTDNSYCYKPIASRKADTKHSASARDSERLPTYSDGNNGCPLQLEGAQ